MSKTPGVKIEEPPMLGRADRARPKTRLTREERSPILRQKIFKAAAKVVGKHGYAEASISRITEVAGVAQGTFYLYFESRQGLFDELLPTVGRDMLEFIRKRLEGVTDFYEREEGSFRAFFEYLQKSPGFFRILNEAEVASPIAHARHFKFLSDHYVKSFRRSLSNGSIRNFKEAELESLAYMLMGARTYLYLRFVKGAKLAEPVPEQVVQTYMGLVRNGLR